jgi:putative transposase
MTVSAQQEKKLFAALKACWCLRNRLVLDRIESREEVKKLRRQGEEAKHLNRSDQYDAVKLYAKQNDAWAKLHSQVRQNVAVRVDEGYKRFFDALKEARPGVKPPRPKKLKHYRSLTYPQYGMAAHIKNGRLHLSNLGEFTVKSYRKIRGRKKTVTVKFAQGRWWCIVTAEMQVKDAVGQLRDDDSRPDVGLDPGLSHLLASSHGEFYDPPKVWHDDRSKLRTAQKKLSRQFLHREKAHAAAKAAGVFKGPLREFPLSNRLKRQIRVVGRLHTRIENVRDHHHKKNAAIIADRYRKVAVEEHGVQFMIRNKRLAKSASDRAIAKQKQLLKSKLGERYVATANRRRAGIGGNSQSCVCGASVPKELKDRVHSCPSCGLLADRDHVSANIVQSIAFGTVSDSLHRNGFRRAGSPTIDSGEVKASVRESSRSESVRATETSMKRRSLVNSVQGSTLGGEPTKEGKTRPASS